MEISKFKMFTTLYKKDMRLGKNESFLIAGIIIVANIFLIYKYNTTWTNGTPLFLSIMLFSFIPASIFIKSFTILSNEWKENTVYIMMSLPISSTMIFLSKLVSLITQLILLCLVSLPFTLYFISEIMFDITDVRQLFSIISELMGSDAIYIIFEITLYCVLTFFLNITMVFFSTVFGKMFKKNSGVISFFTFIGLNFLLNNIAGAIMFLMFSSVSITKTDIQKMLTTPMFMILNLVVLILAALLFYLTTLIYDRKIEL